MNVASRTDIRNRSVHNSFKDKKTHFFLKVPYRWHGRATDRESEVEIKSRLKHRIDYYLLPPNFQIYRKTTAIVLKD